MNNWRNLTSCPRVFAHIWTKSCNRTFSAKFPPPPSRQHKQNIPRPNPNPLCTNSYHHQNQPRNVCHFPINSSPSIRTRNNHRQFFPTNNLIPTL
jgi:hypothetical protein